MEPNYLLWESISDSKAQVFTHYFILLIYTLLIFAPSSLQKSSFLWWLRAALACIHRNKLRPFSIERLAVAPNNSSWFTHAFSALLSLNYNKRNKSHIKEELIHHYWSLEMFDKELCILCRVKDTNWAVIHQP